MNRSNWLKVSILAVVMALGGCLPEESDILSQGEIGGDTPSTTARTADASANGGEPVETSAGVAPAQRGSEPGTQSPASAPNNGETSNPAPPTRPADPPLSDGDQRAEDRPAVTVQVSPATANVALGATFQFSATVTGTPDGSVTWSLECGSARGTISATGLYTAPAELPAPPTATVRATSVADRAQSATAQVTLTAPPPGGVPAEARALAPTLFAASLDVTARASESVYLAAMTVWRASSLNGGVETYTGTLTQLEPNSENFSYAPTPTDRLVVSAPGASPVEYTFAQLTEWQSRPPEYYPFWSHAADFTVKCEGVADVHIVSQATPVANGKAQFQRHTTGMLLHNGAPVTVDLTHQGEQEQSVEPGFASFHRTEQASGAIRSGEALLTVADEYTFRYQYQASPNNHHAFNHYLKTNSAVQFGPVTYKYQDAIARWERQSYRNAGGGYSTNVVGLASYCACSGALLADGQVVGNLEFSGPVENYTHGPDLLLKFGNGESVLIHPLIVWP